MRASAALPPVLVLVLVLALAACAGSPEPTERWALSGDDIEDLIEGRTLIGRSTDGIRWEADYADDGTFTARWPGGGASGVWEVRGDRLCTRLDDGIDRGACRPVVQAADVDGRKRWQILDDDGGVRHSVTLR